MSSREDETELALALAAHYDAPPSRKVSQEEFLMEFMIQCRNNVDAETYSFIMDRMVALECDCGQSYCRGWKMRWVGLNEQ